MEAKFLKMDDFEDLWNMASMLVYRLSMYAFWFDDEGEYADYTDTAEERLKRHRNNPIFKYLDFRECAELKQYSYIDACDMSVKEINKKFLFAALPILRREMRSDVLLKSGMRAGDDIPDSYLDQLLALAWKQDLLMWTMQWDLAEKAAERTGLTVKRN